MAQQPSSPSSSTAAILKECRIIAKRDFGSFRLELVNLLKTRNIPEFKNKLQSIQFNRDYDCVDFFSEELMEEINQMLLFTYIVKNIPVDTFNELFMQEPNKSGITKNAVFKLCQITMEASADEGLNTSQYLASRNNTRYLDTIESIFTLCKSNLEISNFFLEKIRFGAYQGDNLLSLLLDYKREEFILKLFAKMPTDNVLGILYQYEAAKDNSTIINYIRERLTKEKDERIEEFTITKALVFTFEEPDVSEEKAVSSSAYINPMFAAVSSSSALSYDFVLPTENLAMPDLEQSRFEHKQSSLQVPKLQFPFPLVQPTQSSSQAVELQDSFPQFSFPSLNKIHAEEKSSLAKPKEKKSKKVLRKVADSAVEAEKRTIPLLYPQVQNDGSIRRVTILPNNTNWSQFSNFMKKLGAPQNPKNKTKTATQYAEEFMDSHATSSYPQHYICYWLSRITTIDGKKHAAMKYMLELGCDDILLMLLEPFKKAQKQDLFKQLCEIFPDMTAKASAFIKKYIDNVERDIDEDSISIDLSNIHFDAAGQKRKIEDVSPGPIADEVKQEAEATPKKPKTMPTYAYFIQPDGALVRVKIKALLAADQPDANFTSTKKEIERAVSTQVFQQPSENRNVTTPKKEGPKTAATVSRRQPQKISSPALPTSPTALEVLATQCGSSSKLSFDSVAAQHTVSTTEAEQLLNLKQNLSDSQTASNNSAIAQIQSGRSTRSADKMINAASLLSSMFKLPPPAPTNASKKEESIQKSDTKSKTKSREKENTPKKPFGKSGKN